ncbi:MAG TPA: nucleotide exchange factor GrpE [Clostridiales bacterium]|nr:nucleotide exchange factor GrpE [Clostridiales bacterium]
MEEKDEDLTIDDTVASEGKLGTVKKKLEEMTNECGNYLDKYQRTMAEFDNFRKRTAKEKVEMYDIGVMETVEKILPMIDNFERALLQISKDISEEEAKEHSILKGINMIYTQFTDTLKHIGVEEIDATGKTFDPNLHNAVMHVEDENHGENEVIEVFQKGYIYGEKVIRHAMVKVGN